MKVLAALAFVLPGAAFLLSGSSILASCAAQETELSSEIPPAPAQSAEHAWLQQLVGEWTVKGEPTSAMGGVPAMEATETVRSIGGLWVVGASEAEMNGQHMQSMITLGYDPATSKFVGTWVDSVQTTMWVYSGTLDGTRKILTLEAKGPAFDDPTKTALYHDTLEIKSADHRTLTSSLQNPDGTWTTFMRVDYHRAK
jgi:hypothetical protein